MSVQAWAEGKGKGNIARNAATAAGGGAIDSVAEIASGGAEFQKIANEFEAKAAEVKAKLESIATKPGRAGYSKLIDEE